MNEQRRKIIADAMSKFKYGPKSQTRSPDWILKVEKMREELITHARQIAKAGGLVKAQDFKNFRETLFTMCLQKFDSFHKEELMFFATTALCEDIMAEMSTDPWGKGTPDALS